MSARTDEARAPAAGPPRERSELASVVDALLAGYRAEPRGHHINRRFLTSREEIIEIVRLVLQVFYPGYFGRQDLTDENVEYHIGGLLSVLREKLARQIEQCLCHAAECEGHAASTGLTAGPPTTGAAGSIRGCGDNARATTARVLARLPAIRALLIDDIQAAFDGDPAATNLDEIILAYPGLLAVTVYRVAHELHEAGVPLMPRIMTEWAHAQTGADIHPGARIGRSFFLDHATGAVVGETTDIGARVKLYQGVTLGALSHPRDERGRVIRNTKRHPTVEDDVTVYANATVLGGATTLGANSVIGGSVFVTRSVPAGSRVALKPSEQRTQPGEPAASERPAEDFEI